jgi:hypothetical protein
MVLIKIITSVLTTVLINSFLVGDSPYFFMWLAYSFAVILLLGTPLTVLIDLAVRKINIDNSFYNYIVLFSLYAIGGFFAGCIVLLLFKGYVSVSEYREFLYRTTLTSLMFLHIQIMLSLIYNKVIRRT